MLQEEQLIKDIGERHINILKMFERITKLQSDDESIEAFMALINEFDAMIDIFNVNFDLMQYKTVKSQTIVLKQDILNYVYGKKSGNTYIIERYERLIAIQFERWNKLITEFVSHKDYFNTFQDMLVNINTLFNYILRNSAEDIICQISSIYEIKPIELLSSFMGGIWSKRCVNSYYDMIHSMQENCTEYYWLYDNLSDTSSQSVLLNICRYRATTLESFLDKAVYDNNAFFDEKLIQIDSNTVFLDIDNKNNINDITIPYKSKCRKYLNEYQEDAAFGEKVTYIKINSNNDVLDELDKIKDIIENDLPSIAVCVDNKFSDIWEVPQYIYKMNPRYKVYLRYYFYNNAGITVIYAVLN